MFILNSARLPGLREVVPAAGMAWVDDEVEDDVEVSAPLTWREGTAAESDIVVAMRMEMEIVG
jgi:hypothetical protein